MIVSCQVVRIGFLLLHFFRAIFSYEAFEAFEFFGDGVGLRNQSVGQFGLLLLREQKHEAVLLVATQRQRAVVLAEQRCAVYPFRQLGDIDVAVVHSLHLAVGQLILPASLDIRYLSSGV